MTCFYCEKDTADRDTYLAYSGVIFCDYKCLAEWYATKEIKVIEQ